MSEMVERVARALCRQYELDDGFSPEQADRSAASDMHRNFNNAARTAIEAMREPTQEMLNAGGHWTKDEEFAQTECYRAMIEAALSRA